MDEEGIRAHTTAKNTIPVRTRRGSDIGSVFYEAIWKASGSYHGSGDYELPCITMIPSRMISN
jgi:hypothetical protein